jgi:two-component system, chemotaxis family, chemotaxis protein CheY
MRLSAWKRATIVTIQVKESGSRPRCPFVLIVEDDLDHRELTTLLLEGMNLHVIAAENGAQALEVVRGGSRPDVIVTDLIMPVLDGLGLLEALRASPELADIPVIVVSATVDERARQLGAKVLLKKPVVPDALVESVLGYCKPRSTPELHVSAGST